MTQTYYIISINCDCASGLIARTSTHWKRGLRCPNCKRILGPMEYRVEGKVAADGDLDAIRKWKGKPAKCSECGHESGFKRNVVGLEKWLCTCSCHNQETK